MKELAQGLGGTSNVQVDKAMIEAAKNTSSLCKVIRRTSKTKAGTEAEAWRSKEEERRKNAVSWVEEDWGKERAWHEVFTIIGEGFGPRVWCSIKTHLWSK